MIRLATRSSAQARTQSEVIAKAITTLSGGEQVELVFVETLGDQKADVPLHVIGGQGVFVKEVQNAVLNGGADIAVHSAKDLPSLSTPGLVVGAWCERRDARDALVGSRLDDLAVGATVATGSVRRTKQLSTIRPDLQFVDLRGNIHTRLQKIPDGGAIVMAVAALQVLGLTDQIAEILDPKVVVPMIGQGCVAVECRANDRSTKDLLKLVDHLQTRRAVEIERMFLAELGAGCNLPVGAYVDEGDELTTFLAAGAEVDARWVILRQTLSGEPDPYQCAVDLARKSRESVS
ncbi:MAG: hydroxymethylbilane synthase [Ilumatobacteraceae bacterium]